MASSTRFVYLFHMFAYVRPSPLSRFPLVNANSPHPKQVAHLKYDSVFNFLELSLGYEVLRIATMKVSDDFHALLVPVDVNKPSEGMLDVSRRASLA